MGKPKRKFLVSLRKRFFHFPKNFTLFYNSLISFSQKYDRRPVRGSGIINNGYPMVYLVNPAYGLKRTGHPDPHI